MKMKQIKCKIKPFKGVRSIYVGEYGLGDDTDQLLEFLLSMGYFLYENPASESEVIISDRSLTYGDVRKMAKKLGIDLFWWDTETDFNEMADQELNEVTL
jgi:hypothetical protein